MGAPRKIVLGTRGSDLALVQARLVEQALAAAWPNLEVKTEIIRTSGDEGALRKAGQPTAGGRKGMFTREIERQLLGRGIDLAVHSAKDLPSERMEELEISAVLPRGRSGDVLITKGNLGLTDLPQAATIATGSVRRRHQLRWKRPDLTVVDLRGNVPTRLRKLRENEAWSGIILAQAGLARLGIEITGKALRHAPDENRVASRSNESEQTQPPESDDFSIEALSEGDFVPAGGQGIIALQIRSNDEPLRLLTRVICDQPTLLCLRAEREFLRLLEGDCDSPVGVHAAITNEKMRLEAQIFAEGTLAPKAGALVGECAQPKELAAQLMKKLYGK